MKSFYKTLLPLVALVVFVVAGAAGTTMAQAGRIQTTQLDTLAGKASENITITVDESMMKLAAKFLDTNDSDEASVKELISGLKAIHVRILEFDTEGQYAASDIETVRAQVRNPPWKRIVDVNSKRAGSVELYVMGSGNPVEGLTLLIFDSKEITVVNILGAIDLDKLSQLEGTFGIPELKIERSAPKRKDK